MKGYIACALASVPLFKERKLKEPVHLIVSYDEEVGCTGVRPLIARLGRDLPRPRAIIVGEPTSMAVIDAHKRIDAYRTTVHGREAHSSLPALGVNAISAAASLIGELDRIGSDIAKTENDPRFEPPYSTISVGTIKGGTAPNIVPKTCDFYWQVRSLPSASPEEIPHSLARFAEAELLPKMRWVTDEAGIETKNVHSVPAFAAGSASEAVALALKLTGAKRHAGGVLHDRGRAVRAGRMPRRDLRTWRHCPGACGRRICQHRADRGLPRLPRRTGARAHQVIVMPAKAGIQHPCGDSDYRIARSSPAMTICYASAKEAGSKL